MAVSHNVGVTSVVLSIIGLCYVEETAIVTASSTPIGDNDKSRLSHNSENELRSDRSSSGACLRGPVVILESLHDVRVVRPSEKSAGQAVVDRRARVVGNRARR